MSWEVGLLFTALAAAISASDISQEEGGIDTTGALINKTDALGKLDPAGMLDNNTDLLRISEEDIEFHNGNSLEERRGCFPTLSCTRAGGYCIRPNADCNGTIDTQGCRRGRRCKCCIPDQTTSAPLTCPTTQPIHTCPAVTPCPTSANPTTEIPTTDLPTTLAVTTEGTTVNPNLRWLSVGSERFVRFPQEMNWFSARALCQANGLDLFEPKNIQAIAIYLENNFNDKWYWIGSRSNGTHVVWLSGGAIPRSAPWYDNGYQLVGTDKCTEIITQSGASRRGIILAPVDCTSRTNIDVLCG